MTHFFRTRKVLLFLGPMAALLLLFAGIFAIWGPARAHAAGGFTLYVGHTIGLNTGCASPGFTSVQAAVDLANTGNTVYLCGTTPYAEQVIIRKAITLTGDPGATIQAPSPFPATNPLSLPPQFASDNLFVPQAIVIVWGVGSNAKIKNLIINGPLPGNSSCADDEYGVLVIASGTATLNGDHVTNIQDSNSNMYGCQFGVGIQVGREYWPTANFSTYKTENFTGHGTIINTTVSGYQKNGITIDGPLTKATVTTSKVNGDPIFSPTIAQNGIQISRGANAQVTYSTITGNAYTGAGGASDGGILVYGGSCGEGSSTPLTIGTKIQHNIVQNNDVGVYISNLIYDTTNTYCVLPTTPTKVITSYNTVTNGAVTNTSGYNLLNDPGGYQAGVSDEGYADQILNNSICGVGYTPAATPPPYLSRIDVVATDPDINHNTTCTSSQVATTSPWSKIGGSLRLHPVIKPFK